MCVEYQIISSLRLVYVEMPKALSIEELISHLEELAANEDYLPPMKRIVDFSNLADAAMPRYDMAGFDRLKALYSSELRGEHCVFVTPTDFRYGMGRLFDGYMDNAPFEVSVARSLQEALELLDINENELRACQGGTAMQRNRNRA